MDSLLQDLLNRFSVPTLRREPAPRVVNRSAAENVRPGVENGGYSPVYDPPRYSDFNTRASRMPIAISGPYFHHYFAVQQDTFLVEKEIESMAASTPRGGQLPTVERTNITRPPAVAYGSMMVLQPKSDPYLTLRSGKRG